jgi:hypothetical protein
VRDHERWALTIEGGADPPVKRPLLQPNANRFRSCGIMPRRHGLTLAALRDHGTLGSFLNGQV